MSGQGYVPRGPPTHSSGGSSGNGGGTAQKPKPGTGSGGQTNSSAGSTKNSKQRDRRKTAATGIGIGTGTRLTALPWRAMFPARYASLVCKILGPHYTKQGSMTFFQHHSAP
ncbi:hypothetical protein EDD85DRAFT_797459 [Armillaria nabsnona]|nr:hypothetical protein EDD85DRAFT_797459 [Armillaria nabsnona]